MKDPVYSLGHSDQEMERLRAQELLIGGATREFFREAGVGDGMRVLEVGSGAGDTAILTRELVGEPGEVVGTDREPAAIAACEARVRALGLRNVSFRQGNPAEMTFDRPFDAVVGRYVLLFQADPAAMMRALRRHVRPGGVLAFHEPDFSGLRSTPPAPTYDRFGRWLTEVFRQVRNEADMLVRLPAAFVGAGLRPTLRMRTFVGVGEGAEVWLRAGAELLRSMMPTVERLGVATAAEVDIATLAERMIREVTVGECVILGRSEIGGWARIEESRRNS